MTAPYTPLRSTSIFIIIGALAQLLSWTLVTRCTFAYHYFPTSFFLVLALAAMFNRWDKESASADIAAEITPDATSRGRKPRLRRREQRRHVISAPAMSSRGVTGAITASFRASTQGKRVCLIFTAACVLLFALYYPALTGLYSPGWYHSLIKWFPSWVV